MKQINFWSMKLVMIMMPLLMACCSSDDDPISLNSYIVGTWHSFKASGYGNGQSLNIEITKTGEYSAAYSEVTFESGNKAIMRAWVIDQNGLSHWIEETGTYSINGDMVKVKDSQGETADFVFDAKDRTLLIKGSATTPEGTLIYVNIYYTK
jgi:hypothetical protein